MMKISSTAFGDGEYIPAKYSKLGDNVSPPLSFADIPDGAKSLALVCHDPDAPMAGGFTHWVVWNIDPATSDIAEGVVPTGAVQGMSDWHSHSWNGPQPPSGVHRYIFYLYALSVVLQISTDTTRSVLESEMKGHILETATLTGVFAAQ